MRKVLFRTTGVIESAVPVPLKEISPVLRAAAARMEKFGFTSCLGHADAPACFLGTVHFAVRSDLRFMAREDETDDFIKALIFNDDEHCFDQEYLQKHRWNTDDAVAALNIAADYAEAIGK